MRKAAILLALSALLTTSCTAGTATVPGEPTTASTGQSAPARPSGVLTAPPEEKLPGVGECFDSKVLGKVACTRSHDAEVTWLETLPQHLPKAYPDDATLLANSIPRCTEKLAEYMGSEAAPASRLRVAAIWPDKALWAKGQHYVICTVVEVGPDGAPVSRTGSLKGALQKDFWAYQLCTAGSPSKAETLVGVPCNQPHVGEALPAVKNLGKSTDKMPSAEQLHASMDKHCKQVVIDYLLALDGRPDVATSWRVPAERDWSEGYTVGTCFAETNKPVSKTVRGIGGQAELPA
ncbi:septum formation family protein [Crossiella sp. CA198]|uniref:septum formation family protein n=1 Tax=Crossiella sp. CA198 TaxID=3455607 RepID=UPI003F8D36F1